jgi:hypothetical protein
MRPFDLNMEEVLENWEVYHAVREIISNALDEQLMTKSSEIEIYPAESGNGWHIRDYGRGIEIEHFTQNENQDKQEGPQGIIGKFGVGLKDALATLHRNGLKPIIRSAHGTYTISMNPKEGFANIETLHVMYDDTKNDMIGTDFFIEGISENDIASAKDLFLKFNSSKVLETTKYGSILENDDIGASARVYINGVLASEEEDFLFSYNVTNLTSSMRKALNRERTNVGRSTYSERVKSILKSATSEPVLSGLAEEVRHREKGNQCYELRWGDIAQIGMTALAARDEKVIYATNEEIVNNPSYLGDMRKMGYTIVPITEKDRHGISNESLQTFADYVKAHNESFEFDFVDEANLTAHEQAIYAFTQQILDLVGWGGSRPLVRISNTMRSESDESGGQMLLIATAGCYSPSLGIVVKRSELSTLPSYASVLLHEAAHASSRATDATRDFENELTRYLGQVAAKAIQESTMDEVSA